MNNKSIGQMRNVLKEAERLQKMLEALREVRWGERYSTSFVVWNTNKPILSDELLDKVLRTGVGVLYERTAKQLRDLQYCSISDQTGSGATELLEKLEPQRSLGDPGIVDEQADIENQMAED